MFLCISNRKQKGSSSKVSKKGMAVVDGAASRARSRRRSASSFRPARGRTSRAGSGAGRGRARSRAGRARRSRPCRRSSTHATSPLPAVPARFPQGSRRCRARPPRRRSAETERDSGLAGARAAFEQVQPIAGEPVPEHVVQPDDAGGRSRQWSSNVLHRDEARVISSSRGSRQGGSPDRPPPALLTADRKSPR